LAGRPCPVGSRTIRFLASSHQLHQLAPRTLVLTFLLLVGLAGQAVTGVLMHHQRAGWTPTAIAAYYRGRSIDPATLGPVELDKALAGDPGYTDVPPKTWEALLDVAHMHLAWMPLLVFLAAHLFAMTPLGRGLLGAILGYGTLVAAILDIVTPFLVRYHHAIWAWAKLGAFLGLETGMLLMIVLTLGSGISIAIRRRKEAHQTASC